MNAGFGKIRALVDYSTASLRAAEDAALIASKFDSEFQLLHVLPNEKASDLMTAGPEKHEQEYVGNIEKFEQINSEFETRYNVSVTCFESRRRFIDVVKRHVKDFSVDLIVLGVRKRYWHDSANIRYRVKRIDCFS